MQPWESRSPPAGVTSAAGAASALFGMASATGAASPLFGVASAAGAASLLLGVASAAGAASLLLGVASAAGAASLLLGVASAAAPPPTVRPPQPAATSATTRPRISTMRFINKDLSCTEQPEHSASEHDARPSRLVDA